MNQENTQYTPTAMDDDLRQRNVPGLDEDDEGQYKVMPFPPPKRAKGVCCGVTCWVSSSILHIINALYVLFGAIMIGCAAGAYHEWKTEFQAHLGMMIGVIVMGWFLVIEATFGIIGTILTKQWMLFIYMVMLILQGLIQAFVSIGALAVGKPMKEALVECGWSKMNQMEQDAVQNKFGCCHFGGHKNLNWQKVCPDSTDIFNNTIPDKAACGDPDLGGCYDKMHNEIDAAITYGASGGLVFAFTAYVGVCATAIYWMHLGRARKEKGVMSEQLEEEHL